MKIGIFGSAFNPIHEGHIEIIKKSIGFLKLDKLILVPSSNPPHKRIAGNTPASARFDMVANAVCSLDRVEVSGIEIKRQGKSYTIDTLQELRKIYKDDDFFLIIGMDQLIELHAWKDYKKLVEYAKIIVFERSDIVLSDEYRERYLNGFLDKIIFTNIMPVNVSSTMLRNKKDGKNI